MTSAVVAIYEDTGVLLSGHGTTQTSVDAGTIKFGLTDAQDASASPVAQPTATGTNFSYAKALSLRVTTIATTSTNLLNRKIKFDSQPSGLAYHFKAVASGAYTQATAAADTAAGTDGAVPTGYTAMSSTLQTYDSASVSSTALGQNGSYCITAAGVSSTYAAGGGLSANTVLTFSYDESLETDVLAGLGDFDDDDLTARRVRRLPLALRRGALL